MFINFSDIPGQQNLFLDYLYEFENVARFYKKDFRNKDNYIPLFEELKKKQRPHRNKVAEIIQKQYKGLKPSRLTESNLEYLSSEKTIAIVTGQQLGLLGGPLYTIYKILTAIKLSIYLKSIYEDYNFIPVFWLEGDDHDFEEIRSVNLYSEDFSLKRISYSEALPDESSKISVGEMIINESIDKFFDEISGSLRESDFKSEIIDLFKKYYSEGESLKFSFKQMLFHFFDEYGLIIFDPQDKNIKELLKPVFINEIENFRRHSKISVAQSALLDEHYHAQVKVKPVNLFYSDENGRFSVEPDENDFKLKNRRVKFTKDEILELINSTPEKFSPNVLLRPVCQDFILPTGFYVGGPAEISYFAQVIPLYPMFNVVQPIIYPRASATIAEKNIKNIIDKFSLSYADLFLDEQLIINKTLSGLIDNSVDEVFSKLSDSISHAFEGIKQKLVLIEKNLEDPAEKTKENILGNIEKLKSKALKSMESRHEVSLKQINKAKSYFYPESGLQERKLNMIYFLNKYNFDVMHLIFRELSINKFEHQIIEI